jgi:hypothetical protein
MGALVEVVVVRDVMVVVVVVDTPEVTAVTSREAVERM